MSWVKVSERFPSKEEAKEIVWAYVPETKEVVPVPGKFIKFTWEKKIIQFKIGCL